MITINHNQKYIAEWLHDLTLVSFITWVTLVLLELLWPGLVTVVIDPLLFLVIYFVGMTAVLLQPALPESALKWQRHWVAAWFLGIMWLLWRLFSGQDSIDLLVLGREIFIIGIGIAVTVLLYDRGRHR